MRSATGGWICAGGLTLISLALLPIDQSSRLVTTLHRVLTACALASLVMALFTNAGRGWFATASRVFKWMAAAGIVLTVGLLAPGFPGGLWERFLFALLLAWVEILLVYIVQASLNASPASAAS